MNKIQTKPKLVFFQYQYDERLPAFLLMHKREHVKCLSEFFDVAVIHEDCDYQEVCDKHEPDLALFELGVNHVTCRRLKITNILGCPAVPKVGLHNADGFCNARAGFISDMDHWGIETCFAISTTAAEHTPEIADNLFVWPNFIDAEIYRDYGAWKSIPVLFTGNRNMLYPWRNKIMRLVSGHYPSLMCPHPGYEPRSAATHVMLGERYARTINASSIVPACGTVAKEVVRKHFEIPACRACLLTERSAPLEAAGFVDMNNCVFADERDVLDKVGHLFRNPEELQRITDRGFELVHTRHTTRQRDQILQWYRLQKDLQAHQKIVQNGPFGELRVVDKSSGIRTCHISGNGLHLSLLREGDKLLFMRKYEAAEQLFRKCMSYMPWMPEPMLRMAICELHKGNAEAAQRWLVEPIQFILARYQAVDPDPVEWAYYMTSLLCQGKLKEARKCGRQFPWLSHPELDRARWAVEVLTTGHKTVPSDNEDPGKRRHTIHLLPGRSFEDWFEQLCQILIAGGQHQFAETLGVSLAADTIPLPKTKEGFPVGRDTATAQEKSGYKSRALSVGGAFKTVNTYHILRRRLLYVSLGSAIRRLVAGGLHRLEAKYGYFLPYHLSEMRKDEFLQQIRQMVCEADIKVAVVIGAASGTGSTDAFLAAILENQHQPKVFCINRSNRRFTRLKKVYGNHPLVKCGELSSHSADVLSRELDRTIKRLKGENGVTNFDAILVASSALDAAMSLSTELKMEIQRARFVFFADLSTFDSQDLHQRLLRDPNYALIAQDPGLRNGYAIFERHRGPVSAGGMPEEPVVQPTARGL